MATRKRAVGARRKFSTEEIKQNPEGVLDEMRKSNRGVLSDLFPGDINAGVRAELIQKGNYYSPRAKRQLFVQTKPIPGTDEHEVLAVAAVARDPGLTQDYIDAIADFAGTARKQKADEVSQLWEIYYQEGIVNNAVNKIAATLSTGGTFKVRRAKQGKRRKAQELLQAILDDFVAEVNSSPEDGVVTGSRGLQAIIHQAVRIALVEGDWIGRTIWGKKQVGVLGKFEMPVNIQSITTAQIEPVAGLSTNGVEAFFWKPPQELLKLLDDKKDIPKELKNVIQKFIPKEMIGPLKKDKKVFLDPALLLHIKHRGVDNQAFGESFIKPAMQGIAFKRSVEALDMVSMQNLINRLTIIMVGSEDPKSPYAKAEVQQARTALMQSLLEEPGPNMTIVWQGPDIKVEDVGAGETLSLDTRHNIAEGKIKIALGVPDALLAGTTTDGKSAGWAAALGAAAELMELQNAFANAWTQIGKRIANENGFEDVEVVFQFDNSLMVDKAEEWNQLRNDAIAGLITKRTFLKGRGFDVEAEYLQKCFERGVDPDPLKPESTYDVVFAPMLGLPGQGVDGAPPGLGGGKVPGSGRTPNSVTGKPQGSPAPEEKKTPAENK